MKPGNPIDAVCSECGREEHTPHSSKASNFTANLTLRARTCRRPSNGPSREVEYSGRQDLPLREAARAW